MSSTNWFQINVTYISTSYIESRHSKILSLSIILWLIMYSANNQSCWTNISMWPKIGLVMIYDLHTNPSLTTFITFLVSYKAIPTTYSRWGSVSPFLVSYKAIPTTYSWWGSVSRTFILFLLFQGINSWDILQLLFIFLNTPQGCIIFPNFLSIPQSNIHLKVAILLQNLIIIIDLSLL